MAATTGEADSAGPPSPCDENTEPCSKCMYIKYEPEPEQEFEKILSPSDIQRKGSYRLYLPKPRAARFCTLANGSHPVSVYDVQMKRWPMRCRRSGGKAYLTRGWSRFAKQKNLSEGDRITFYELNCKRGTGKRVFMMGVSRKGCTQILGAAIRN
ncbi:B3 domain-containing transcription factor NGA1-like [Corylus avellana]|uniref:B3 domain-containing transcription factor NGA1-like n=1 Tax=Corylus avellana TaxID=13451 RepID=UPI00286B39F9|nr:B3 domain-containing transcription factor NGA1-like [Corylus avellana]